MSGTGARISSLLSNSEIGRVERLRLNANRRFTNRARGEHLAGRGGSSIEFADFRDYQHGDDIKYVDWNIFARLQRPYLKLYRQEEELTVTILIDASESMGFGDKLLRAKQYALATAIMGLWAGERVTVHVAGQDPKRTETLRPARGRGSLRRVIEFIERIEPGGAVPLETAIEAMLMRHRGRGVCLVLSDFLTGGDIEKGSNALFAAGLEQFLVQVLSGAELDPEFSGDMRLVDSETEAMLDVSGAGGLLAIYQDHLQAFADRLGLLAKQRSGRFMRLDCDEPFAAQFFEGWRRAGWVVG